MTIARQPGGAPNRCAVPRWARQQRHNPVNKNFGDRAQVCTLSPKFFARLAHAPRLFAPSAQNQDPSLITFLGLTTTIETSPFATRNLVRLRPVRELVLRLWSYASGSGYAKTNNANQWPFLRPLFGELHRNSP